MIIPINDKWRIASDERNWTVQTKITSKKRGEEWLAKSYHATLAQASQSLSQRLARAIETNTLTEALVEIEQLSTTLTGALTPHFKPDQEKRSNG